MSKFEKITAIFETSTFEFFKLQSKFSLKFKFWIKFWGLVNLNLISILFFYIYVDRSKTLYCLNFYLKDTNLTFIVKATLNLGLLFHKLQIFCRKNQIFSLVYVPFNL